VTPAVSTRGLSKRYRKVTALSEITLSVPEGRISALLGPNGAGKTTLLRLLAGLSAPSGGEVAVLGGVPRQEPGFLADIGFLAQDIPLYRHLTGEDHLGIGAHLNPRWDEAGARERLAGLGIPLERAVGTLSGGQRAQLALALTLAKRPRLLLLDEPVAALDPLARRRFLATLADAVAVGGLTVMLSSHLVFDLERVCDHLILLAGSRVPGHRNRDLRAARRRPAGLRGGGGGPPRSLTGPAGPVSGRYPRLPCRAAGQPAGARLAASASRATCSDVRDSGDSRLTPRIRSMCASLA
jgi:ABC-2 type transport system ATP-binding protein